jgi:predicted SprT family Zn-dependent metalloprotease
MIQTLSKSEQAVVEAVHFYVDLANEHSMKWIPYPTIRFDISGSKAGEARTHFKTGALVVRFNPLFMEQNLERVLNVTVPHEVAHIVADYKDNRANGHGEGWRAVMRLFGFKEHEIQRCYEAGKDFTPAGYKPVTCRKCRKTFLAPRRHVDELRAGHEKYHAKCGGRVALHAELM